MESVRRHLVGNTLLARELEIDGSRIRTRGLWLGERQLPITESTELALVLDAARWRHDIESWRWRRSDDAGEARGYATPELDDSGWRVTPHLHPIYDSRYDGHAWFRQKVPLSADAEGEPIVLGLGGMDDEDWGSYRVFVNGRELGSWAGEGRWREPHLIPLAPGDAAYGALRFGGDNLLAVEVARLFRGGGELAHAELEHYFFQGWLIDQFVAVGEPYEVVNDFAVVDVTAESSAVRVSLESGARPGLAAELAYSAAEGGALRKQAVVRNRSDASVRLLDVVFDDLEGSLGAPTKGGRGRPVLASELFLGIEHPAGIAQGEEGRIRLLQLPGRTLEPGESYATAPGVIGRAHAGQTAVQSFAGYILGRRERRSTRTFVYSPLGWTDFTNDADPLPRITEELIDENVSALERLAERGVTFDIYMIDDWYDAHDLAVFNREAFPGGSAPVAARVHAAGLDVGLWSATTRAIWSAHANPAYQASIAGGCERTVDLAELMDADGKWTWDDVFARVSLGEMRFCWAAEPFRSDFSAALRRHVADTAAALLKLDCTALHCTSSAHGHLAGRYSVEPICDSVIGIAESLRAERPDLQIVWYWGFQSPWWLMHGDIQFDKALKLEAASPATSPAPTWRQGVALNTDQAVDHARLVPLELQDSLGVWIGDVAWANRMGKVGWQDAFLLDLARGSSLVSFWGDVESLDDEEVALLADAVRLMRFGEDGYRETVKVGGDPWASEPYGYLQPTPGGPLLTAYNPSFESRTIAVELGHRTPDGPAVAFECYPCPGRLSEAVARGGGLELQLEPWEVKVVVLADPAAVADRPVQARPERRQARRLDLSGLVRASRGAGGEAEGKTVSIRGTVRMPDVARNDLVVVAVRVHKAGVWHYHPEPQSMFSLRARMLGIDVRLETTPQIRSWNGPGCPWVAYTMRAGHSWAGRELDVALDARLDEGVDFELEGWVFEGDGRARRRLDVSPLVAPLEALP